MYNRLAPELVKIGFLVNPIAGMGGPIGLGGSDDLDEEMRRAAKPVAGDRAISALESIKSHLDLNEISFLTCSGAMGGEALLASGIDHAIVYEAHERTGVEDTIGACETFLREEIDILLFVGGDGTARDIIATIDKHIPILGVPSGVKMHSSVFSNKPEDAGWIIRRFSENNAITEGDIMDVDEAAFRAGRVSARLYGIALVPDASEGIQVGKSVMDYSSESAELEGIAAFFVENMDPDMLYIMSTGSTISSITRTLGIEKNELTVNAILSGAEIGKDLNERGIIDLMECHSKIRIVVTPIGGQGFVFGRGNQQISAEVLARIENEDILIVATPSKLRGIRVLRADTGDPDIDNRLRGYWKVLTGYGKYRALLME